MQMGTAICVYESNMAEGTMASSHTWKVTRVSSKQLRSVDMVKEFESFNSRRLTCQDGWVSHRKRMTVMNGCEGHVTLSPCATGYPVPDSLQDLCPVIVKWRPPLMNGAMMSRRVNGKH